MYNHNLIEKKWRKFYQENKTFKFSEKNHKKFYVLDMFPYPSGQGLHVGHPKGYTATDIIARYKVHQGFDVLHPIGWDAFGLPAEQYALQTGNHPEAFTLENIDRFRQQLNALGFNFDPEKEINTTDSNYYKWTQWIFAQMFKHNLATIQDVNVNWCEELGTVLANEEVLIVDNQMVSERGNYPVIKKPMRQWVLKITNYAEKLLEGLDELDWPESLKNIQRKWIGKSIGANIKFQVNKHILEIFTTRSDTIFGVTYLAIAPEHSLVKELTTKEQEAAVEEYLTITKSKTDLSRKDNSSEKTGVFTGSYATHPITEEKIPIYVADYVLAGYATEAVMGVPGHDQRDFLFAKKYQLPIKFVIETKDQTKANEEDGKHLHSSFLDNLNIEQANKKMFAYLEENNLGNQTVTYKLKDWLFSRQRYWGEPFPIYFDEHHQPILDEDLPVLLPKTDQIKPSKDGTSPLSNLKDWLKVKKNNQIYYRDTNTMPQWAGSCWYYLAYILKNDDGSYLDLNTKEAYQCFEKWLPVDIYIGGQEHAVLHLLYARFWHRFLYDIKVVPTKEPFMKMINQGMILGPNGEKMSKSKGNVVNPDDIIASHGADALRLYEAFMGPLTASLPWTEEGINGVRKWLDRVHRLYTNHEIKISNNLKEINHDLLVAYHHFVKKVTSDIEIQNFNVAISEMMIYINECYKNKTLYFEHMINFLVVLSCFAPFISDELYSLLSQKNESLYHLQWPQHDENYLKVEKVKIPVSENGKVRDVIMIKLNASQDEALAIALKQEKVKKFIGNRAIKKVIFVSNKILNIIL